MATSATNRLTPMRFVLSFGVLSMFADVVYEGARSVTGPYLATLGASAAVVGAATGAGEAVALVARLGTGRLVDRTGRPWALTIAGYLVTLVAVPLLALTTRAGPAIGLVITERFGKALRAPARDTMLAHAGAATGRGKAFSVHKALDQVGSFLGPLVVSAAITLGLGYRGGFAALAVPGLLAAGTLLTLHRLVPQPASYDETPDSAQQVPLRTSLTPAFWHYAIFTALMMIGFATFGVLGYHLEARDVVPPAVVPLVYAVAMGVGAVAALGSGWVYDRVGLAGLAWLPLAAAAVPWLSFATRPVLVWIGAAIWGATLGVQDSTMRAAVADIVPAARRGSAYGVFAACYGLAWLGGGTLVGALYEQGVGVVGGVVGLIELVALVWFLARVLPAARAARAAR